MFTPPAEWSLNQAAFRTQTQRQACIYKAARQVKEKMHVVDTRFLSGELAWVAALRVTLLRLLASDRILV